MDSEFLEEQMDSFILCEDFSKNNSAEKFHNIESVGGLVSWSVPAPSDIGRYTKFVNELNFLSEKEEKDLAIEFFEKKNLNAAKELIFAHLRLVVKIAREYSGYGLPQEDLIQEGNVGLMKAVRGFDPYKGVRLVSYANLWIKAQIQEFVLDNWRLVKIGTTKALKKLFFNFRSIKQQLNQDVDSDETSYKKIAKLLDVEESEVKTASEWFGAETVALDAPIKGFDSNDGVVYSDFIAGGLSPVEQLEIIEKETLLPEIIKEALGVLSERDSDIIYSRYLAQDKSNLTELANKWNISAERVRQIEVQALKQIRNHLGEEQRIWLE